MRARLLGFVLGTSLILHALPLKSANLTVIPGSGDNCSDGEGSFQECLDFAESNNAGDTLQVQAGDYDIAATLEYFPAAGENFPLTIENAAGAAPVLSSNLNVRCMYLDTSALADDGNADLTVSGLIFQRCKDPLEDGGAIQTVSGFADVSISEVTFDQNESGEDGGALDINSFPVAGTATVSILDSTFTNNKAEFAGAFSVGVGGTKTIEILGNTIVGNAALSDSAGGGSVFLDDGTLTLSGNLVTGNQSANDVGGIQTATLTGSIVATNNVFFDNLAGDGSFPQTSGGGLQVYLNEANATAVVTNNTLIGNRSLAIGGGLMLIEDWSSNRIDVYNNIVFGNQAPDDGADIYSDEDVANDSGIGTLNLFNNIFDAGGFFSKCLANPPCTTVNGADSATNLLEDPLLVDPANGDFAPGEDSPAIEAGDPAAPQMPSSDFLGNPRPTVAGNNPDIGAIQFQPEPTPTPTPIPTDSPSPSDGGCALSSRPLQNSEGMLAIGLLSLLAVLGIRRRISVK